VQQQNIEVEEMLRSKIEETNNKINQLMITAMQTQNNISSM
jgi:hypothetical protein